MYRRNSDESIRALERNAHNSDNDFIRYAVALSRTVEQLPTDISQELRRIWRSTYELECKNRRSQGGPPFVQPHSSVMRDMALINTDIFLNTVLDHHDRPHQLYLVIRTMLQDMSPSAALLDIAGWLWDRRKHRIVPGHPQHTKIVEPRLSWFSFDLIDLSWDIYGSGIFPEVSALRDWHQLTQLTDRTYHDPRKYKQARPSAKEAIDQVLNFFQSTFGVEPIFPLQAVHGTDIYDTYFRIYIMPPQQEFLLGTLYYKIEMNQFITFKMELEHQF